MASLIKTYNFGPGNPDPGVFPSHDLGEAARRALSRMGTILAQYPEQRGLPELRGVAQARFERNHHVRPPLENIVITNGAMQGLQLSAMGLARPGDSVVLEEFEYVGTIRVFKQCGLELVPVAIDDEGMRMDDLESVLERQVASGRKPAFIYTTASYQNPTGTSQPVERRRRLLELARRYQITIVEDDTYADISFEPPRVPAIYSLAQPGEVVYIGSFSKILGPGVRLGFFIADESTIARMMPWKMDGGTSMLSQLVAAEYFKDHLWDHIEEGRQAVKDKRNTLLDALEAEFGSVPGMSWTRPEGGLFLWVKLPPEVDRVRLQQLATEAGIVYSTGQAFQAENKDVAFLRLAFGWIEREEIAEGIRALAQCVRAAMATPVPS
ncbi:MAG: PLP-dependent aminotransferase family protein [Chloroflexi bacterium]|nr:PLP-dependent aminotransferase family protein [Chloroflexota bacterium]MBV9898161.1 PLP-dependent aminotransferase family protein [Chloroflexota bacterium]